MAAAKGWARPTGPTVVRDPEQRVGGLRILQQTTGRWFVHDDRRAGPDRAVPAPDGKIRTWKTMDEATAAARRMVDAEAQLAPGAAVTLAWTMEDTWQPKNRDRHH